LIADQQRRHSSRAFGTLGKVCAWSGRTGVHRDTLHGRNGVRTSVVWSGLIGSDFNMRTRNQMSTNLHCRGNLMMSANMNLNCQSPRRVTWDLFIHLQGIHPVVVTRSVMHFAAQAGMLPTVGNMYVRLGAVGRKSRPGNMPSPHNKGLQDSCCFPFGTPIATCGPRFVRVDMSNLGSSSSVTQPHHHPCYLSLPSSPSTSFDAVGFIDYCLVFPYVTVVNSHFYLPTTASPIAHHAQLSGQHQ